MLSYNVHYALAIVYTADAQQKNNEETETTSPIVHRSRTISAGMFWHALSLICDDLGIFVLM